MTKHFSVLAEEEEMETQYHIRFAYSKGREACARERV